MLKVLVVSQVIPQWYVDLLTSSFEEGTQIDIITGTDDLIGHIIPSPKHNPISFKSRLLCWFAHYRFMKRWMNQNKNSHYDLIFAVSNPPINPAIGLKLKKIFHAPFVYMNWDLYPHIIEQSIQNPIVKSICCFWYKWNRKHYPNIDRIITIGTVMQQSMLRGINGVKSTVIPIAVNTDKLKPIPKIENSFANENGLAEKFIVLYSGKMGLGHNIELILDAAKKLKSFKDINFVFIGNGPKVETVKNYICETNAENVKLFPLQPENKFNISMAIGDIGIVTEETKMSNLFMPSKTYSMMSCGQAIIGICSQNDDLYNLINSKKIGYAITNNDVDTLAEYILKLYNNKVIYPSKQWMCERYNCKSDFAVMKFVVFRLFDLVGVRKKK